MHVTGLRHLFAVVVVLGAGAACTPTDADDATANADLETPLSCAETVEEAARASEPRIQVRLLDRALLACRSYTTLSDEIDRFPGMLGYDTATFVERRCSTVDDDEIRSSPACSRVVTAVTTVPTTEIVELVFVGDTLDGRQVEIRPGPSIEFVGEVPAVIQQTVDIALESQCEGVLAQRDLWASRVDESTDGDIASVYAQHAQNVANYIECDAEPIASPSTVADG